MSTKVTIKHEGKTQVHMSDATGNYATMCGLDGNDDDPSVDQFTVPTKAGAKIDCPECFAIWQTSKGYKTSDFKVTLRSER